ncbi:energy transducer TonB [Ramlibacter sp.]|uniref:energy transducer TonB n=1 Tax=Ramlibacter sp. TaxID=1917967 RepID=UPI003D0E629F
MNRSQRNYVIAGSVVLFHAAALWALQSGLVRRVVEVIVPVTVLSELITPPTPVEPKPVPPPPRPPEPKTPPKQKPTLPPAPQPVARAEAPATPNAPTGVVEPQPPAPPIAAPVAPSPAPAPAPYVPPAPPPAPPSPPKIELPSSDANYLQNPKPAYPPLSRRMGEQGTVMLRALIGADGNVQRVEILRSSGYDRLDQAALAAVRQWRFVPGKRGGVPTTMSHDIPLIFNLD